LNQFFADYEQYLISQEKSYSTIKKYLRDIVKFFLFIGHENIDIIAKTDIITYKQFLLKNYKPTSVNTYLIALNVFLSWYGLPELRVKTVRIQHSSSVAGIFTYEEYMRMLNAARAHRMNRIYLIMRSLAASGIRISELQYITVEMLPTGQECISSKGKIREIFLPSALCDELRLYCAERSIESGIIFHGRDKNRLLDKACIWRELKTIARLSSIAPEQIHAHTFRHFFAKEYLQHYNDIIDLADILGHNSLETTRIYTRTSQHEKHQKIENMAL
jgi:integrase/recombinase XerD